MKQQDEWWIVEWRDCEGWRSFDGLFLTEKKARVLYNKELDVPHGFSEEQLRITKVKRA